MEDDFGFVLIEEKENMDANSRMSIESSKSKGITKSKSIDIRSKSSKGIKRTSSGISLKTLPLINFMDNISLNSGDIIKNLEDRLMNYMNESMKGLINEVSLNIRNSFEQNCSEIGIIQDFYDSLMKEVRKEINLEILGFPNINIDFDLPELKNIRKSYPEVQNCISDISSYNKSIIEDYQEILTHLDTLLTDKSTTAEKVEKEINEKQKTLKSRCKRSQILESSLSSLAITEEIYNRKVSSIQKQIDNFETKNDEEIVTYEDIISIIDDISNETQSCTCADSLIQTSEWTQELYEFSSSNQRLRDEYHHQVFELMTNSTIPKNSIENNYTKVSIDNTFMLSKPKFTLPLLSYL